MTITQKLQAATQGEQLAVAVEQAMERYRAMSPDQQAAMWQAQRESYVRAEAPCEHGDPDWDECALCIAALKAKGIDDE
jgi:hypothetical protein